MRLKAFSPFIIIGFAAGSCVNMGEFYSDADCVKAVKARTLGFQADVQPVLVKYCVACHSNMPDAQAYKNNYYPNSGADSAYTRSALPLSNSKHMPTGSNLTTCSLLILQKWESDGYAN
jgi:hypothetical protein